MLIIASINRVTCCSSWWPEDSVGGEGERGGGIKQTRDIKNSDRQTDPLAERRFWLEAYENSSVDAIPAHEWYPLYRDESRVLFSARMQTTLSGSRLQVTWAQTANNAQKVLWYMSFLWHFLKAATSLLVSFPPSLPPSLQLPTVSLITVLLRAVI